MLSEKVIINEFNKQKICKSISWRLNNIKLCVVDANDVVVGNIDVDYTAPVVVIITKIEPTGVGSYNKRPGNLIRYIPSGGLTKNTKKN